MDPATVAALAQAACAFVLPHLPTLLGKASEGAASEIGKKAAGETLSWATALWGKLFPKLQAKPAALDSLNDVSHESSDADTQAAFRQQVKKLLLEDDVLAQEVKQILDKARETGVTATGDQSVAVGGDVVQSIINTGTIQR